MRKLKYSIISLVLFLGMSVAASSSGITVTIVRIMDQQGYVIKGCDTDYKSKPLQRTEIKDFIRMRSAICCEVQKVPGLVIVPEYILGDNGQPAQASYNCPIEY